MPKIIENLEARLIAQARRQILENGYCATTIRSVAAACGVGTGTVYNYFPSKQALAAAVLLEDWKGVLQSVAGAEDAEQTLHRLYDGLTRFREQYAALFADAAAAAEFPQAAGRFHPVLRGQLAELIRPWCGDDFTAAFAAEALLTWTMAGEPFPKIHALLRKLL